MSCAAFCSGEPIHARPVSRPERAFRWVRRNKTVSALSSAVGLALLLGTVVSTYFAIDAHQQATVALAREQDAQAARRDAVERQKESDRAREEEAKSRQEAEARAAETAAVLEFVETKVFAAARPQGQEGGLGPDVRLRDAIGAAVPSVETSFKSQPLIEARLRKTLGQSFLFLGDATSAAKQLTTARELFLKQLGAEHADTLQSMHSLANSYTDLGRYADALKLNEETLTLRKATLGSEHPDTLASMHGLANSYADLGRYEEALKLNEKTLALRQTSLGRDHLDTLASMQNLASSYYDLDRDAEALKLREERSR